MVARGNGAAGPVLLACRQWDPLGLDLGCLAQGLGRGAVRHYCLGGCSAPSGCARRSRPVRGARAGTWCCVSPVSAFPPRVSRAACGGPSRPGVPYPRSLVRHSTRSVRSASWVPLPLGGVACAPRAVPALGAGRAVPSGPCPSACPAPVPCSVWRALEGGGPVPVPPYLAWPARPVGAACRGGGGGPFPGGRWPATVARGVWCQALSLPLPPVLWGGRPGSRDPCVPGAVGAGVGPSTGPTACALAGRRCSLWGWRKGVPGGGAFHRCEGRLSSGALPPPTARLLGGLLGSATHVLWARLCGCGGPTLSP